MKVITALCLALVLGGCNRVHSDHPLFFPSDAPDAPRLKEGLWVIEDAACHVDASQPVNYWPDCGSWMVVRKREIIAYDRKQDGEGTWTRVPYVLEGGDPFILQAAMTEDGKTDYEFFGVAVQRERPVTFLVAWPVLCGPPPPEPARGEKASNVTLAPLPGMTVVENNCTTTSADAVRGAVRPSQDWSKDITSARWVRDTYP